MKEKTIYIVTCGEEGSGANPSLTESGRRQIVQLPFPHGITLLIAGTGTRFRHTLERIIGWLKERDGEVLNIPIKYSPLCGSADSGETTEAGTKVVLADGTPLEPGQYIGLIGTSGIGLPVWVRTLPDKTLLVADVEFLGGLGYNNGQPGCLYAFDRLYVKRLS